MTDGQGEILSRETMRRATIWLHFRYEGA